MRQAPPAPPSPESCTTARGPAAPAPHPAAARSSPQPTRRTSASFMKPGRVWSETCEARCRVASGAWWRSMWRRSLTPA
ncbi:MCRIP1 isoform 11 [Pan troglodytes]|uniref:MCRIP1 isoform 11 n=1 Tax=Pan troglodytes TaxID=9598 RepID=A0A2J8JG40_PANTR|nr:MCRIP1 isoform 11 [Pan troglodytes]